MRGGYGLFYAPWNYSPTQHGQIGFTRDDVAESVRQHDRACRSRRSTTRSRPACMQPIGSSLGLLTGTGGDDQLRRPEQGRPEGAPVLVRRPARAAGRHGRHRRLHRRHRTRHRLLRHGSDVDRSININQIDPAVARAAFPGPNGTWNAAALRAIGPQPVLRHRRRRRVRQPRRRSRRGQLLRPFPQFGDVFKYETTDGGRAPVPRRDLRARQAHRPAGGAAASATR